jgi:ribosomal protein S27E
MDKSRSVIVRCPDCKQEYVYGFVYSGAVVGSVVPEGECRICGKRVVATIIKLEPSPPVEDDPIRGGWSR